MPKKRKGKRKAPEITTHRRSNLPRAEATVAATDGEIEPCSSLSEPQETRVGGEIASSSAHVPKPANTYKKRVDGGDELSSPRAKRRAAKGAKSSVAAEEKKKTRNDPDLLHRENPYIQHMVEKSVAATFKIGFENAEASNVSKNSELESRIERRGKGKRVSQLSKD